MISCKTQILSMVNLNEPCLKIHNIFPSLHQNYLIQIVIILLGSNFDDQIIVESILSLEFTWFFVPADMFEITQHAYLLTVFLGLLNAAYNWLIPLLFRI